MLLENVDYSVRRSRRTKRLHLKIDRFATLEVVAPIDFPHQEIHQFVNQNKQWIDKQKSKYQSRLKGTSSTLLPPEQIHFSALNKAYNVRYSTDEARRSNGRHSIDELGICIYSNSPKAKYFQLQMFVHHFAKQHLVNQLEKVSVETGLEYNRVYIRNQKTRWGSCSRQKNINLNRNILFLSQEQMNYLLIHELCHTRFMNHSSQFWQLVEKHCRNYQMIDTSLRKAVNDVPIWAIKNP